jgi:predicted ATPase
MFRTIRLVNFKAWKDSGQIPLAPLTVIVGLNNSGKSSILHGILALKQTAQSQDARPVLVTKGIIDLNGFRDILHSESDEQSPFSIELGTDPKSIRVALATGPPKSPGSPPEVKNLDVADKLEVSFRSGKETRDIELERSRLLLGQRRIIECNRSGQSWSWSSDDLSEEISRHTGIDFRSFFPVPAISPAGSGAPIVTPEIIQTMQLFALQSQIWTQVFLNTYAIVPLRQRVPWSASEGARTSSELGAGGGNLLAALGSTEKVPLTSKTLVELVSDWFASKNILKRLRVEGDKATRTRMLLGDEITGPTNINVAAMGEGISQVLPIVARTLSATFAGIFGPCILVEQPEIHLHPALQADLADLFIEGSRGQRQIIVETHSEHFVLRVRRRIAEGTLDPATVSILYVEKRGLESKARPLNINEKGDFSDWPEGFFDQAYQEAMAMAEAAMRKG